METKKYEDIIEVVDSMNIEDSDKVQILNFIKILTEDKNEINEE